MDKLDKLLEYVTAQEEMYYDYAEKAFKKQDMMSYLVNQAQASAFQRVRYVIEDLMN